MTTTSTFAVVGVYCAAVDSGDGILHISALVECVGVYGNLYVISVGNAKGVAYSSGC